MRVRDWTLQYSLLWASLLEEEGDCLCPDGFSSNGEECVKVTTLPTEQPPSFTPLRFIRKSLSRYSVYGTMIYNPGFNLDGTSQAGYTYLDTASFPFWGNPLQNDSDGPMNRSAIWSQTYYANQEIGFAVCINIPVTRTYLVGYGVDNYLTLRLDGEPVLQMTPQEVASTFNYFRIYPVTIKKGIHVLEIIAYNKTSVAAIGAEIYDATPAQLMDCQSQEDLDPLTVFSTRQMAGLYTNLGSNGYPVMPGYALVLCDGNPPYYRRLEYSPCQPKE